MAAPAVATGVKRVLPDNVVFAYQGDGDLGLHRHGRDRACGHARREYHRHLHQQRHLRHDRRADGSHQPAEPGDADQPLRPRYSTAGYPVRVCELLSSLDGVAYLERVTVDTPKNVRQAESAIKKAFQNQIDGIGYSLVEVGVYVPHELGSHAAGQLRVDAREHAAILSAGRVSRCGCRWVRRCG